MDDDGLSFEERALLNGALEELKNRKLNNKFLDLFPDTGMYRRELYQRHLAFFRAGALYRERCFMAGNRVGKTVSGAYETVLHLTGLYPDWWDGRRFYEPVRWWAAGKTNETCRDIVQTELLGDDVKRHIGTGLIPKDCIIGRPTWKSGVPNLVDTILVKHVSGGFSKLGFKAYKQGRGSFEGTAQHGVWCDEEPPMDVYGEILIRTATTDGLVLITFTPLEGMSEVVMSFLGKKAEGED